MDSQLLTLSKIFTERLFRIPDYQRGYAWGDRQLKDFWTDIDQLDPERGHYAGVLTLENVPASVYEKWQDDTWIEKSKSYEPFYVVDGQQRLTTSIILIQVILETISDTQSPNFTEKRDIQRKYIFDSKNGQISRSYIFGYERDNPSYNYLKSEIFGEWNSETNEETVYTQNLSRAKEYFRDQITGLQFHQIELLYTKVTQNLLFNIFTISNEVDVCVAFETMNNRGKPLSVLELLKNRLIYLSLKFDQPDFERDRLRKAVNDCWRSLYHNLGRNKDRPLNDDRFLAAHYMIYFDNVIADKRRTYSGQMKAGNRYLGHIEDLLEKKFISRNIIDADTGGARITLSDVYDYVSSLQESVEIWYTIFNPGESNLSDSVKIYLDRLMRLGIATEGYLPLILIVMQRVKSDKKRLSFLRQLERFIFVIIFHSPYFSIPFNTVYDPVATEMAMEFRAKNVI